MKFIKFIRGEKNLKRTSIKKARIKLDLQITKKIDENKDEQALTYLKQLFHQEWQILPLKEPGLVENTGIK